MKYILKPSFPLIIIICCLFSCKKVVQSNFSDIEQQPVVNSILKADSALIVNLSYTTSLNPGEIEYIDNATIRFYVDGNIEETVINSNNGMYSPNIIVEPDREYSCEIDIPGQEMLTCKTIIPRKSNILN